ncbi:hypothetical protein LP421_34165 (plasmid) [Rhizobium sp. RCAM05350]|uniref:hypothetical protein n=1 Tax=Rhizobium sp. RCAM05350 TaxID=2895568 RepID=UPI002076B92C|nr:hypothetical protein [Rhizobium sp. RCAM05350]URK89441.1 hypothetical protein LP421_34165 [Rhizobium sp. RCAM05350]
MIEVAATLKEMGIEPFMSSAASHRIKAGAGSLAKANLSKTDDSVKQLAAALAAS